MQDKLLSSVEDAEANGKKEKIYENRTSNEFF